MILANYVLIILWFCGDFMVAVPSWCPCFKKCNTMSAFHRIRSFWKDSRIKSHVRVLHWFQSSQQELKSCKIFSMLHLAIHHQQRVWRREHILQGQNWLSTRFCVWQFVSQEKLRPFLQYKSFKQPYRSFWKPNLWISCGSTIATIPWKSASLTLTPSRNCFRIERNLPKYPHMKRERNHNRSGAMRWATTTWYSYTAPVKFRGR